MSNFGDIFKSSKKVTEKFRKSSQTVQKGPAGALLDYLGTFPELFQRPLVAGKHDHNFGTFYRIYRIGRAGDHVNVRF